MIIDDRDRFDSEEGDAWLRAQGPDELATLDFSVCRDRVQNLIASLKQTFVDKDSVIKLMAECTTAGLPLLLLGTWGTAKSMLVRRFAAGLGLESKALPIDDEEQHLKALEGGARRVKRRHFEYLITKFTTPEELLGGMHVKLILEHAVFARVTRGLLPTAEILFLDEVFKANSAILNSLLSALNERLVYNAGVPWKINMVMLFGASNESPQEKDLGAFYDRFPVRVQCDPVRHESKAMLDLLKRARADALSSAFPAAAPERKDAKSAEREAKARKRLPCVNDFRLLQKVNLIHFDEQNGQDKYIERVMKLRRPYAVSDRSVHHFYRLASARALLDGRHELRDSDFEVLEYCAADPEAGRKLRGVLQEL